MRAVLCPALLVLATSIVTAKNIYINVGGNITNGDLTKTFSPQRVDAEVGDIVFFNFTAGNHSATQSTFDAPCVPAHVTNITINGFDSGFRNTVNGTAPTVLSVPILDSNVNTPFWFYDASPGACGAGAVGAINNNESSGETVAGFEHNAIRFNGTASSSSVASSTSGSASASAASASSSSFAYPPHAISSSEIFAPLAALAFVLTLF